jgi:hypothetical protein
MQITVEVKQLTSPTHHPPLHASRHHSFALTLTPAGSEITNIIAPAVFAVRGLADRYTSSRMGHLSSKEDRGSFPIFPVQKALQTVFLCRVAGGMVTMGEPSAIQEGLTGEMEKGIGALVVYTSHM